MKDILLIFNIFTNKQLRKCVFIVFMMMIGGALESIGIGAILPLISIMQQPNYLLEHPQIAEYMAVIGVSDNVDFIILSSIGLIFVYFIKDAYMAFQLIYQRKFVRNNQIVYMKELLSIYFQKDYEFHVSCNSATLLRNITSGGTTIFGSYLMQVLSMITEIVTASSIWIMLVIVDPFTAIVVAGAMGAIIYAILRSSRRYVHKQGDIQNKATAVYMKWVNQGLGAVKETKVMGKEKFFLEEFEKSYSSYATAWNKFYLSTDIPRLLIEFLVVAGLLGLIIIKLSLHYEPTEIVSLLGLLALAAFRLMPSANRIVGYGNTIKNYIPFFKELYPDLLLIKKRLKDGERNAFDDNIIGMDFEKGIEINNIKFGYSGAKENVLNGVSFFIPKGSFVGIVGPSGAGKTTFVDILLGLLTPKSGSIKCDGKDIFHHIRSWQRKLAYVPQDIYLIDGTVMENIALGVKKEDIDVNRVREVLKMSELYDLVINMPNGIETFVGERGVMLSGGQRQRIGVARALYQRPNILVLDEATSALDNDTEKNIMDTILKLKGKVTIISIAHRLSTLEHCDFKVKLDNGGAVIMK